MEKINSNADVPIEELIGFLHKFNPDAWQGLRNSFPDADLTLGKKLGGTSLLNSSPQVRIGLSVAIETLNTIIDRADEVAKALERRLNHSNQLQFWGLLGFLVICVVVFLVTDYRIPLLIAGFILVFTVWLSQLRTQFSLGQKLNTLTIYYRLTEKSSAAEYLQNRLLVLSRTSISNAQLVETISNIEKANYLSMEIRRLIDQSPYRKKFKISDFNSSSLPPPKREEKALSAALIDEVHHLVADARTEKAIQLLMGHFKGTGSEHLHDLIVMSAQLKQYQRGQNLGLGQSPYELNRIHLSILEIVSS